METPFSGPFGAFNVILTKSGRDEIINWLNSNRIPGHGVQALVTIAKGTGNDYPNIYKHTMVNVIRMLCDIHRDDSQVINAYQARVSQLERRVKQLETERQTAARQKKMSDRVGRGTHWQLHRLVLNPRLQSWKGRTKTVRMQRCNVARMSPEEEKPAYFTSVLCACFFRSGTNCRFQHPTPCPFFEIYGNGKFGCRKGAKCKLMHRTVCKQFMNGKCTRGRDCGFYHPLGGLRANGKKEEKKPQSHKDTQNAIAQIILALAKGLQSGGGNGMACANNICDGIT